ncbi:hypothetical protein BLIN9172_03377 [Brevibacterium linens ATCC 9172]|uniref:Uncharacterized protein n=3 Tax=Brevibacteriaceae TaxID=85019 RepID=A0A2H1KNL3_BRELN|nr:hypothetical protein BANT10_02499 [Brevibacterium antiquum]SMY01340.1 hypothetical protein BLIN9172_03377 [Brevibacterium linens ATCC 9172]
MSTYCGCFFLATGVRAYLSVMNSIPTPPTGTTTTTRPRLAIDDEALTEPDREAIRQAAKTTAARFPPMSAEQAEMIRHQLRGDTTY